MAQSQKLSPRTTVTMRLPLPSESADAPRRVQMATRPSELMAPARTRRGSTVDRRLVGERCESPERSMRRRVTKGKSILLAAAKDFRNAPRGRVASLMEDWEEDELRPSGRRPSSLPGITTLGSQGSGLGYFKDKWKDIETAMQPELRNRAYTEDLRRDLLNLTDFAETKDMGHAVKEGYITEDFSRLIFDKFRNEPEPEFLNDINLEACGGLGMVKEIPLREKYFWFLVLVVSVAFNVIYLLHMDWAIFKTYFVEVFGTLDWRVIVDRLSNGGGSESKRNIQAELLDDDNFKASIFGLISDHQTRMLIVNSAVVVATWEVLWLFVQLAYAAYLLFVIMCDTSEYKRYHAIGQFFQRLLPQVSTFSAVKLLARVHPSLISHEFRLWLAESSEKMMFAHRRNACGYAVLTITFIIFNICCAIASVSAFSVKMLAVSFKLVNNNVSVWLRLASILATLNQVVGAVYLERVLQDRIFLFVFGGRDANYEDDELAYRNAYETRLMKEIWQQYVVQGNGVKGWRTWPQTVCNVFNALVLLATLDHYDLQYLMVEDPEEAVDLFERLGLVQTAGTGSSSDPPKRSVSAPDDLIPSKRDSSKEAANKRAELSTCERLWAMLNCRNAANGETSRPERLNMLEEEGESLPPSRVNSPSQTNSPLAEVAVSEVNGYQVIPQDQIAPADAITTREPPRSPEETAAVDESAPPQGEDEIASLQSLRQCNSMILGPVCSEQDRRSCNVTESAAVTHQNTWATAAVTHQNTWANTEDPERDSSQPAEPCSPPEEDLEAGSAPGSVASSGNRSGLARLFRRAQTEYSELSQTSQARRSPNPLAWGDGSEMGVSSASRSETKDSFDPNIPLSPQAAGDDMV